MTADELIDEARAKTALGDFGEPSWREGLDRLCDVLSRAPLSDLGRMVWRGRLLGYGMQRLRVEDWHRRFPEIALQAVPAPIFVVGLPRSGTTALSHLLAQDPETRSLRVWESSEPTPPPEAAKQHDDPRIARATQALEAMKLISPKLAAMHEDTPTGPTENQDLLGMSFRTYHFDGMAEVRAYTEWWLKCEMAPAYRFHRRVLQLLQWRCGPTRWHLKSPPDSFCLEAILAVYPDARFVMTHRDPAKVLASVCSIIATVQEMTGKPPDAARLGAQQLADWSEALRRLLAARARIGETRFADVHFDALNRDPLAVVAAVYAQLGIPFTAAAERAMRAHAAANPRGKHGAHRYALADWGLGAERVRQEFRFYLHDCGVREEDEE